MSAQNEPGKALVSVKDLKQHFDIASGLFSSKTLKAVDGISFDIYRGETLGLVGESGCGKTTAGRSVLHLYRPTSGSVVFDGQEISSKSSIAFLRRNAQIVFQDPYSSLDPRMTVGDIIGEPLDLQKLYSTRQERNARIRELMDAVDLSPEHATRYAHEFSGGQRQRIGIARALSVNPRFIVADEPVSALDVSIQAQVVNMFEDLQERLSLTYLFIAHDLSVVRHISNRIAVMYLGKIVEMADAAELYSRPAHPYTISLLSAVPIPDPIKEKARNRIVLEGDVPSPLNMPQGCSFRTRCTRSVAACAQSFPELVDSGSGHFVACHSK